MIAVISYPEDPHATAVIERLRDSGTAVTLIDLSDLPDRATLTIDYERRARPRLVYRNGRESSLDLRTVTTVWWRRPQAANPTTIVDPDVRVFAVNEWQEAVNGLWQLLDARWVNDPVRDDVAARKALQLAVAADIGLTVPRTLVTSDPDEARAFIQTPREHGTIFKTFSCTHEIWRETRLVRDDEISLLDSVRLAPVIFQEYVPADVDLRVTVVGRRLFTAAIRAQETSYPVDFRMSLGEAEVEPATLPAHIESRLLELMDRLGLAYGAIDIRRRPDGEHVFLEVNTAGEFLFVEDRTRQPITAAVAELLAG